MTEQMDVKIKDIARLAGTSVATVSRVINGDARVRGETRARVQAVIDEAGYVPNAAGRQLRRSSSKQVLVVLPAITNPVYGPLIRALTDRAAEAGYAIVMGVADRIPEREAGYLAMLEQQDVDGAILFATALEDAYLEALAQRRAVVTCLTPHRSGKISCCCIDNRAAAKEAAEYLFGLGHRRIAVVRRRSHNPTALDAREEGVRAAAEAAGLSAEAVTVLSCGEAQEAYDTVYSCLQGTERPTAVFCFADVLALPVLKCLGDLRLTPGTDIDVMGFDDIEQARYIGGGLSTVAQPLEETGACAFELLAEKMEDLHSPVRQITVPHRLVVRQTTKNKE